MPAGDAKSMQYIHLVGLVVIGSPVECRYIGVAGAVEFLELIYQALDIIRLQGDGDRLESHGLS